MWTAVRHTHKNKTKQKNHKNKNYRKNVVSRVVNTYTKQLIQYTLAQLTSQIVKYLHNIFLHNEKEAVVTPVITAFRWRAGSLKSELR